MIVALKVPPLARVRLPVLRIPVAAARPALTVPPLCSVTGPFIALCRPACRPSRPLRPIRRRLSR